MQRLKYVAPAIEVYAYCAEAGFATTLGLFEDYVLIEGDDRRTLRAADEVTEYTDDNGEFGLYTF